MKRRRRYRDHSSSPSSSPPPPDVLVKRRRRNQQYQSEVEKYISDLTQVERKVWVGNLNSTSLDESRLKQIFTDICPAYGITRNRPIQSIWLSKEKNFCFVEFRNIKDAEAALEKWRSIVIPALGQQALPVGPPRERTNFSDDLTILKDYVYGESLPRWNSEELVQIRDKIRAKSKKDSTSFEERYKPQRPRGEVNIPIPGKGSFQAQTEHPDATTVLRIKLRRKSSKDKQKEGSDGEDSKSSVFLEAKRILKRAKKMTGLKDGEEEDCLWVSFRDVDSAIHAKDTLERSARTRYRVKFVNERKINFGKSRKW